MRPLQHAEQVEQDEDRDGDAEEPEQHGAHRRLLIVV
jgi:hypothetical protein